MTSTEFVTHIDNVPVRLWIGVTRKGTPLHVFVHRLCAIDGDDVSELVEDLAEMGEAIEIELARILSVRPDGGLG